MASIALVAETAPGTTSPFERALQRYLFALERVYSEPDDSNEASDYVTDALVTAENALMAVPATNFDQLRVKADVLWADPDSLPPDRHVMAFFADLIRLTGNTPSRLFNPARWLERFERTGGGWVVQDDRTFLMWPDLDRVQGLTQDLEMRGGKQAVLDLIRTRRNGEGA